MPRKWCPLFLSAIWWRITANGHTPNTQPCLRLRLRLLRLPEKPPSTPNAPFRRPSETPVEEVGRHGCRTSPDLYRDVLSGRASGAGEFVRVARLHRARMVGHRPLPTLGRGGVPPLAKVGRPRGRNKRHPQTPMRRATPDKTLGPPFTKKAFIALCVCAASACSDVSCFAPSGESLSQTPESNQSAGGRPDSTSLY
ncbi:hypothetical protein PKB_5727 [Pseudomonas knackmussii B13]|uniref:Uncharacterized protein n=1 Tax=Pseudomonas knackmussii (strain DSM 6978 / CCUG 54928 / LMG 23759 / B13) TaxID=1301098 RepID=A0A024HQU3_PSEKB|nr:hypothetical protein PKB_5727 [Pseudomonas knackmussii B13]